MRVGISAERGAQCENVVVGVAQHSGHLVVAVARNEQRRLFVLHVDHQALDARKGVREITKIL